ncbi:MAG: putative peptidase [Verrucomicrobiales bacterium]|nr:putative peptidase [Verrucomicrobiales bacterium]
MQRENLLMVADSERDANMLYAVRMFVPDAFIYLRLNGKCHVVMSDLEIDRARKEAAHCKVISQSTLAEKARSQKIRVPGFASVIATVLKEKQIKRVWVPANFPLALARDLQKLRIDVQVKNDGFYPQRQIKKADEVKKLSAALMMAEVGLSEGIQVLKRAKIGHNRKLVYNNVPLTSEKLRAVIDTAVIQAGGLPAHTIVAGGAQGCDPHERGHGILRANEPIILDCFPRSQKTGYFGDITRTVVKGRASDTVRKMYDTVARGQEIAFQKMRSNVAGREIHDAIQSFFVSEGFKTGKKDGRMQGFFHGTGHGVGLEIHEAPRVSGSSPDVLKNGHVVTVEPGLYYSGIGGVRIEDMAHVTHKGARNLTKFEKVLEV